MIPHQDVRLSDGRRLRYEGRFQPPDSADGATYLTSNGLRVLASLDRTERFGPLLHVSLSYRTHAPTWPEITAVKAAFFGRDLDAMMLLPREAEFVHGVPGWENSQVFHLWACPERWEMR